MTIGVYSITNKVTNEKYIGSSVTVEKRFRQHKNSAVNPANKAYSRRLYEDIRTYGLDSFEFKVLETCLEEDLLEREIYYYELLQPEYNECKPCRNFCRDKLSELSKTSWKNRSQEAKQNSLDNLKKGIGKGIVAKKRLVTAINLKTGEEIVFNSLLEAEKTLSIPRSSISQILNENHYRTHSKGFTFK